MNKGTAVLDIEGTAIIPQQRYSEKIHMIGVESVKTGEYIEFEGNSLGSEKGLRDFELYIKDFSIVVGHNIIGYDSPTLRHHTSYNPKEERDTFLLSKILFGDISISDKKRNLSKGNVGKFGLESWGERFGYPKLDYYAWCEENGIDDPWGSPNEFMWTYMKRDVNLTTKLYRACVAKVYPELANNYQIDHHMQTVLSEIRDYGIDIDVEHLDRIYAEMEGKRDSLKDKIISDIPPSVRPKAWKFTPKPQKIPTYKGLSEKQKKSLCFHCCPPEDYNQEFSAETFTYKTRRLKGDVTWDIGTTVCKIEIKPFNPTSRPQVSEYLISKGWKPAVFTEKGAPSITYEVLQGMKDNFPISKPLHDIFMLSKRMSFLYAVKNEGKPNEKTTGVKSFVHNGKVYPNIQHYGASRSGRCSHSAFNISATASVVIDDDTGEVVYGMEGAYGADTRACVYAGKDKNYVLVGSDIGGVETGIMSHYLYPYDGGEFAEKMSDPSFDIHEVNKKIISGLNVYFNDDLVREEIERFTRGRAKGVYYAGNYGATARKIGSMVLPLESLELQKIVGKVILKLLAESIKGMPELLRDLKIEMKQRGDRLMAFDRLIPCDQDRLVLNRLVQGSAARVGTYWVTRMADNLQKIERQPKIILFSHDEVQIKTHKDDVEAVKNVCSEAISWASEALKLHVPLHVDTKVGENWAQTH